MRFVFVSEFLNSVSSLHNIALCWRDLHFRYWGTGVPRYVFSGPVCHRSIVSSGSLLSGLPLQPTFPRCALLFAQLHPCSLLCHSSLSYTTFSSVTLHPNFPGQVSASCDPLFSFWPSKRPLWGHYIGTSSSIHYNLSFILFFTFLSLHHSFLSCSSE